MSHVTATNDEKSDQPEEAQVTLQESQPSTLIQVSSSVQEESSPAAGAKGITIIGSSSGRGDQEPNSKSSSTKSKRSKVSVVSSTPSIENGYGKHHQLLQERSSQSSTSIILNQPHPPNSWIEQIQFKAQYCHFRCNDYVTVINSAKSLDQVEELAFQEQLRAEQCKAKASAIEQPSSSRQRQCSSTSPADKAAAATTAATTTSSATPKPLFRWHFPRVRLPRLFNAKSLDDITNTRREQAAHGRGARHKHHKEGRSQSSTSHEIHSVLSRTTAQTLKDNNQPVPGPSHRIGIGGAVAEAAEPPEKKKKGHKKQSKPRPSDTSESCSTEANLGASKLKPSSSSSSSENGAGAGTTIFRTTRVIDGTGGLGTTTTTTTVEVKSDSQGQDKGKQGRQRQHSQNRSYFINCAKSDTCINNINRVHSSNLTSTRFDEKSGVGAQAVSICVPCCTNPNKLLVYNNEAPKTTSVDNLDLVSHSRAGNDTEFLQAPAPEISTVNAVALASTSKKKITFLKPVNKVTPIQTYSDEYEEVAEETTMELPNSKLGVGATATAKPKLVVTSVSYLQRPMSPSPNPHTTSISVTPGIVLRNNYNDNDNANDSTEQATKTQPQPSNKSKLSANDRPTATNSLGEPSMGASSGAAFSIKNYLGELIKEKCITKRTETKHVERIREKVKDKRPVPAKRTAHAAAGAGTSTSTSAARAGTGAAEQKGKPEARSPLVPLEVFYDKLERIEQEHYKSSAGRFEVAQQSGSSGPPSTVTSPDSRTNDQVGNSNMSDLQSPQYVKKTASMFNSKMNTASSILHRTVPSTTSTAGTSTTTLGDSNPYYASSFLIPITTESKPSSKDGQVRHIAIERNGNGNGAAPSYLNVSKSVSGYHGLAYNSGSSEKSNGHLLNGSSGLKNAGGGANGVLRSELNSTPQYTSLNKVSFMNDGHHIDNGDPPPLPKTCPPLSSPSLVNTNSSSSYKRVANSSSSVGNDFCEESSEKYHVISSQQSQSSKPESGFSPNNKPAVPEKSRVLEQIQKLYGDQQVTANTPGVLFRRHYSHQPTESEASNANAGTGKVRTIPIQCTNVSSGKENTVTRNIPINKSQERIIPIAVDRNLQESRNAPPLMRNKTQTQGYEKYEKEERVYEGVNVKSSPGHHNLFEFEKYSNTNEVNFNTTANSNSNTSTSKTDHSTSTSKINGSNISEINIHRDSADKNIHKTSITIPINVQNSASNSNGAASGGVFSSHASADNHVQKGRPMASVATNSNSSVSKSASGNVTIIPVQVRNDLESDRTRSPARHQNSVTFVPDEARKDGNQKQNQPISKNINKENDLPSAGAVTGGVVKDGHFFLQEVHNEKAKIEKLIAKAVEKLDSLDPSSDESGIVRAAIGKAKLLINKKFKQFEELCETNLKEQSHGTSGEPFTTQNDDLAGFWDMVLIQVDQIHQMFEECDPKNSATGNSDTPLYQRSALAPRKDAPKKIGSPTKSTPAKAKPTATSSTPNARDEMRRKMIADRRKAMKNAGDGTNGTTSEPAVEIFVPESQS